MTPWEVVTATTSQLDREWLNLLMTGTCDTGPVGGETSRDAGGSTWAWADYRGIWVDRDWFARDQRPPDATWAAARRALTTHVGTDALADEWTTVVAAREATHHLPAPAAIYDPTSGLTHAQHKTLRADYTAALRAWETAERDARTKLVRLIHAADTPPTTNTDDLGTGSLLDLLEDTNA